MNEEAAELLAKAADYIERYGWRQDGTIQADKGRCAVTAICEVSREGEEYIMNGRLDPVFRALSIEIGNTWPHQCLSIAKWNDAPGRTKEEVVAALRNAKRWL